MITTIIQKLSCATWSLILEFRFFLSSFSLHTRVTDCVGSSNDFEIGITETDHDSWQTGSGNEYPWKRGIMHQDWNGKKDTNDIAIYELEVDSDSLPIGLEKTPVTTPGISLTVIGFGDTHPAEAIDKVSDTLLETTVNYVDQERCVDWMEAGDIQPDMLCAFEKGEDSCSGDSGGPIFLKGDEVSDDSLVGLVSWYVIVNKWSLAFGLSNR